MQAFGKAAAAAAVGFMALAAAGTSQAQDRVQMLTSPVGSMVNTVGTAISSVVARNTDLEIGTSAMAGPQIILPQANNAPGSFTLLNAADAYQALRGVKPAYRAAYPNLRLVSVGFSNPLGVLVRADSDIKTGADLKGRRVTGVFSAHKTCEQLATAQLADLGQTWDDVTVVPVTHSRQAAPAIAEGRADVAMCVPVGQAVVKEVNAQVPVRFVSLDDGAGKAKVIRDIFPAGKFAYYKAGSSDGVLSDVAVWSYPFYLVANAETSDDAVYKVTKAIYENIEALRQTSPIFRSWKPETMAEADSTIPYHPGAIRFFKEAGLWTDAMQQDQDRLLAEAKALASN